MKDSTVATKMADYVHARGRVSHDGMLRASKLLQHMVTTNGAPLQWAQTKMDSRWTTLTGLLCANTACTVPRNGDFVLREPGVAMERDCAFTRTRRRPAVRRSATTAVPPTHTIGFINIDRCMSQLSVLLTVGLMVVVLSLIPATTATIHVA